MNTHKIKVIVLEDDVEVSAFDITYYEGQEYTVQIVTPDMVDKEVHLKAGA